MVKFSAIGNLFVMSGPSGVGKDTLAALLYHLVPGLVSSVSVTSRNPRPGEIDSKDYFFKSKTEISQMIKNNELLEWNEYSGNIYGTPKFFVEENISCGKDILLIIDVNGAMNVKKIYPKANLIFVEPPSLSELKSRLINRGTESSEQIDLRLNIVKQEMQYKKYFDVNVINDDAQSAAEEIAKYILLSR